MRTSFAIGVLALLLTGVPAIAQAQIREQRVQFQAGTTGANVSGQIRGEESVDYLLNARAGQTANISLGSRNPQLYFNLIPPSGSSTGSAIHIGSTSGNQYEGTLPESGDYRVRVYLMRPAARRGEVADYVLDMNVSGSASSPTASNPTGPYTTDEYDATTTFRCEVRDPSYGGEVTHSQSCPAGILRGDAGSASIRVQLPSGGERVLNFNDGDVTTPNGGDLTWGKSGDEWSIGIDGREFFVIPEAAVYGG